MNLIFWLYIAILDTFFISFDKIVALGAQLISCRIVTFPFEYFFNNLVLIFKPTFFTENFNIKLSK